MSVTLDLSTAKFVKEAHRLNQMPDDAGGEIAFAGRSNAGKSSVLNALTNRRSLARTSRTPGRTQQFVVYEFAPGRRIIDLPGFGFAKVSKTKRDHWSREIPKYLETRRSLLGLVLVVDSRHPLKDEERQLISWCEAAELPALVLLNKCDKLKQKEMSLAQNAARGVMQTHSSDISVQLFSATARRGVEQALTTIAGWFDTDADA